LPGKITPTSRLKVLIFIFFSKEFSFSFSFQKFFEKRVVGFFFKKKTFFFQQKKMEAIEQVKQEIEDAKANLRRLEKKLENLKGIFFDQTISESLNTIRLCEIDELKFTNKLISLGFK
jgi:hypothetical protein